MTIQNSATGLYLDGMGSTTNGADLGQWPGGGSSNQQWDIVSSKLRIPGPYEGVWPAAVVFRERALCEAAPLLTASLFAEGTDRVTILTRTTPALPAVRRRAALEILRGAGAIRCDELQRAFDVSRSTASRDIDFLVVHGLAVRVHGGAVSPTVARSLR